MKDGVYGMCLCRKFLALCSTSRLTLLNNYHLTLPSFPSAHFICTCYIYIPVVLKMCVQQLIF
jgi:hypothetical protein